MSITDILNGFFARIERTASVKYYPLYLAFFLMLCSLFFSIPCFRCFDADSNAWNVVILKSGDLTNNLSHIYPGSWLAKKVFRLTVPVIMKIAHLSPLGITIMQYLIGISLFICSYLLSRRILNDAVSATLLTAGVAFLYFGRTAFYDITNTWFDGFAYFFLIAAMYNRNVIFIFLLSCAAAWTDERGLVALSIVLLFHQLPDNHASGFNLSSLLQMRKNTLAIALAIVLYIALRLWLSLEYDMQTPSQGASFGVLKKTITILPIAIWTFLEGFWAIYLVGLLYAIRSRHYALLALFIAIVGIFTIASGCVTDMTRSGSYMVPLIFVLIFYLQRFLSVVEMRTSLFICFGFSFLFPAAIVCADSGIGSWFQWPSFINALRLLINYLSDNGFIS